MTLPVNSLSEAVKPWLCRKLTCAAISTVVVASCWAAVYNAGGSDGYGPESIADWLGKASALLLYVTPVYYLYGVPTSMLVEFALFGLRKRKWPHRVLSLCAHVCFGWLLPAMFFGLAHETFGRVGMACAAAFFLVDIALSARGRDFEASHAVLAFIFLPLTLFFIAIIGINL
ncbi:hypothetical protein [Paenibacillus glycinis]|uniref:Uncharacterized protein n=1 Tax=Paenibacillus glycinis TaxID=2697035 RepID=A0ABW9XN39_9BACL|nr:hypothetical protein [Paenibacillus glycinis]NBD24040.1 hypothetical protein [Paenibacillus glycinis]